MEIFSTVLIHLETFNLPIQVAAMVILFSFIQSSITKLAMHLMD